MPTDPRNKLLLDAIAAIYDEAADTFAESTVHSRTKKWTADHERFLSGIPAGGSILDLGFGSGWDLDYFSSLGYEVAGIDISRRQVARARERHPDARLLLGDISRAHEYFEPESFHGAWACAAIVHIDRTEAEEVFRAIHRLLLPGGSAYVSVKCRTDVNAPEVVERPSVSSGGIVKRYVYWLPDDLFASLERAGLRVDGHEYSSMNSWDTFICVFLHKA